MLASDKNGLREIVPNAGELLNYLDLWKTWRISGRPMQIRSGGLLDQLECEIDAIYAIESEFQQVAVANGKPGL